MKKIVCFMALACMISSCYKKFRIDYDHTTVAFSTATGSANTSGVLGRTIVKGEGLSLNFGVYLAGVLDNHKKRWVKYVIDPSLLAGTSYKMMPKGYYTLSNDSEFIIPPGKFTGQITITVDSAQFVNDPHAVNLYYAIPFRLTETSEDSVLATQKTKILVIRYINHYEGFYDQTGSFETYNAAGNKINSGPIDNVIQATTVGLDTVRTDGLVNQKGDNYQMDISTGSDGQVTLKYFENPNPPQVKNIALNAAVSTSYVSPWETLKAVNDGAQITNSADVPRYGNWPNGVSWQWVQYDLPNTFNVSKIMVYWGSDGGGLMPPTDSYVEYRDISSGEMKKIPNSVMGSALNQYNTLTFSTPVLTNLIRLDFIGDAGSGSSTSIIEWQVYGLPAPVTPEQAPIAGIEAADAENTFDPAKNEFDLNYKVNYKNGNYTVVKTKLIWRNRIRDGINEWRR